MARLCDSGLLQRLLMHRQRLNTVADNVELLDLAVQVSTLTE